MGRVTEQNAKEDKSVRNIRITFHSYKMEREGKPENILQGNQMNMDVKSTTGSKSTNGLRD